MTPALKQRLVGAAVLVALAVIFVPMLLDGSGARKNLDQALAIPDKPEAPTSQLEPSPSADADKDRASTGATDTSASTDAASSESGGSGSGAAAATASGDAEEETGSTMDSGTRADEANDVATDSGSSAPAEGGDDHKTAQRDESNGSSIDEGWIIQVGSFQKKANALVMRDRLRNDDFDASAAHADANGSTLWRVRLGPVAERSAAEALQQRYQQSHGGDTLLMRYP